MKRLLALLLFLPLLVFGEGTQDVKVGTQTHNVLAPLTINWTGTTLDFTGSTVSGLGGGLTLKTNGTTNGSQTLLNLAAGSNVTLTDNGSGQVTIASTAGGSGTVTSVAVSGANGIGISGSPITTSGTIALSLGAITPTTVNGNTITTGTGTLTLGSVTLNAGAGGTLGSNAFTSTAYVPTSRTLTIGPTTSDLTANRTFLSSVTDDAQTKAAIVPNTAPSAGQLLAGNAGGTAYAPVTLSGSGATATLSSAGVLTLSAIPNATLSNSAITIAGTLTSLGGSITLDTISGVSSNGFLKRTSANTWTNDSSTYLTGNQTITLSSDVTGSGTTSITTTLANIPSAVPMAGSLLATAITAPSTPAAGKGSIYVDSTSKNLAVKDDAGVIKHGVQTKASTTSNFLTAISDAGLVSAAQPASTDISGLGTLATQSGTFSGTSSGTNTGDQTITLTGAVTGSGTGSFATTFQSSPSFTTPLLGTPTSGTLTNCTGLPVAGITASTSTALGVGSIELGHASDTTITRVSAGLIAVEGSNLIRASDLGSGMATFLATPSSANLRSTLTDEIGTGAAVFDGATLTQTLTTATTSTSLAPINIPAGTLKTTPSDGDIEEDANVLYGCTDAGNRGYIPVKHIIRADTTVTQSNDNSAHAIFTTPANGRLTLETGTYRIHGLLVWTSMSATSGNLALDILGAGTATTGTWLWTSAGQEAAVDGTGNTGGSWHTTNTTAASIIAPATNTNLSITIDGSFEVTVAGTIIPTQTLTTAAAAVLAAGSFIEFWRVGSTTMTSVGQFD